MKLARFDLVWLAVLFFTAGYLFGVVKAAGEHLWDIEMTRRAAREGR